MADEQTPKTYTEDDIRAARAEGRTSALKSLGFDSMTGAESAISGWKRVAEEAKRLPEIEKRLGAASERMKRIAERELSTLTDQQRAAVAKRAADPEAQLEYLEGLREGGFLPATGAPAVAQGAAGTAPGSPPAVDPAKPGDATAAGPPPAAAAPAPLAGAGAPPPAPPPADKPQNHATRYDDLGRTDPVAAGLYYQTWGPVIERERSSNAN